MCAAVLWRLWGLLLDVAVNGISHELSNRLRGLCENLALLLDARQRLAFGKALSPRLGGDSAIGSFPLECMECIAQFVCRV